MSTANISAVFHPVSPPPILHPAPARTGEVALRVEALRKSYGSIEAVAGLSFEIHAGEVFGLLGPNGAGKTTTISVLATQLRPTSGDAVVFGHSVRQEVAVVRRLIGVVPQDISLYPKLTAAENIKFFGRMYGVPKDELSRRLDELLDLVGLETRRNDYVDVFSGGMKRRLNLAVSLIHRPALLLLDEPTVGVDPHSREHLFSIVRRLRSEGTAILYTTHYMEEAERLCDRIVIIDHGKVLADDTVRGLYRRLPASRSVALDLEPPAASENLLAGLAAMPGISAVQGTAGGVRFDTADFGANLALALEHIAGLGARVTSVKSGQTSLEDVFITLTGHALRDGPPADTLP